MTVLSSGFDECSVSLDPEVWLEDEEEGVTAEAEEAEEEAPEVVAAAEAAVAAVAADRFR